MSKIRISKSYTRMVPQPSMRPLHIRKCLNANDPHMIDDHKLTFRGWYTVNPKYPIAIFECACGRLNYQSQSINTPGGNRIV